MQQFRNLLKGWMGKVLLVIFILPFAFFGIEGIFSGNSKQDIAIEVNGVEISKVEVSRAIQNQRQNLKAQMGGNIDDSFLTDDMLSPGVVENLIQRELVKQALEADGLTVAPELVKSYVRSMPQFQDESGEFSNERLEVALVQANYTKLKLYSVVQESMVMEQLQAGVGASAFITEAELENMVKLSNQKRDVAYAKLDVAPLKKEVEISDDELQQYFEENKAQYRTEEKVKLNYIALGVEDFASAVEVSEADIQAAYEDYMASQKDLERRKASHILVEINDDRTKEEALARIEEAKAKLDGGSQFESLTESFSDDIATAANGGDLDFAGRGVYDPAFEEALFSLKEVNQVSDIVETEFGYHLIKLTAIEAQEIAPLAEIEAKLTAEVKNRLAQEELDAALDELNRLAYESGDLQVISEQFSTPIKTTDLFARNGGSGIAADNVVVQAAFSDPVLQEGLNSDVLELADGKLAVVHLNQHEEARDRDFSEVKAQISSALELDKAKQVAKDKAQEIVDKIRSGESTDTLAEQYGLTWKKVEQATRQSSDLSRSVINTAFTMAKPLEGKPQVEIASQPNGDQEIVILSKVEEGDFAMEGAELIQAKSAASDRLANEDFQNYVASLRESAEVTIY